MVKELVIKVAIVVIIALVAFCLGNFMGARNITPFPRLTTLQSLPKDSIISTVRALSSGIVTSVNGNILTIENQGKIGQFPIAKDVKIYRLSSQDPTRYGTASANIASIQIGQSASLILELRNNTFEVVQISQPRYRP